MISSVDEMFGNLKFLGKTLLCLKYVPLLFWGCMPYIICSAPFMVQYTMRIIHVVPMMLYPLAYCGLLFFSLVGLVVCSCSQILQIYVCKMIVGYEFLIVGVDSELLSISVVTCLTIGGESFHIVCIVAL